MRVTPGLPDLKAKLLLDQRMERLPREHPGAEWVGAKLDAARERADAARERAEEMRARLNARGCSPGLLVVGEPPFPDRCLVAPKLKVDSRNPPSLPFDPPPRFPRPPRIDPPDGLPRGRPATLERSTPADGVGPTNPTSPNPGGRAVQSDTLDPQGQAALEQTFGGPLRPGENTLDSVPTHSDVDDLNLPLSSSARNAVKDERYNGRMIAEGGRSYAFAFENAVADSAQRLGVPEAELLSMVQAEEAGHAAAASRYPGMSSSDNEVVGEAVSSRVSPRAQTLTALSDLVADGQGLLDSRYDQCSAISRQAISETLGAGGDVDAFMRSFTAKFGAGQTAADALAGAAAEFAPGDPAGFVARLESNMASAFQGAADTILQQQGAATAATA